MTLTICSISYLPKCIVYNKCCLQNYCKWYFLNLSNCKTSDNTIYKHKCVQKHFKYIILLFQLVLGFLSILLRLSYNLLLLCVSLCLFSLSFPVLFSQVEVYFCKTQVTYRLSSKAKMLLSWAELFQQPRYSLVSNVHKWLTWRNLQMIAVKYVSLELQLKAVKQIPHWIFQVSNLTKFMSGGTCDLSILFPFNTPKSEALDSS